MASARELLAALVGELQATDIDGYWPPVDAALAQARAFLAAPEAGSGIDVERLARALRQCWHDRWESEAGPEPITVFGAYAEDIAAAYAAAAQGAGEETQ